MWFSLLPPRDVSYISAGVTGAVVLTLNLFWPLIGTSSVLMQPGAHGHNLPLSETRARPRRPPNVPLFDSSHPQTIHARHYRKYTQISEL